MVVSFGGGDDRPMESAFTDSQSQCRVNVIVSGVNNSTTGGCPWQLLAMYIRDVLCRPRDVCLYISSKLFIGLVGSDTGKNNATAEACLEGVSENKYVHYIL